MNMEGINMMTPTKALSMSKHRFEHMMQEIDSLVQDVVLRNFHHIYMKRIITIDVPLENRLGEVAFALKDYIKAYFFNAGWDICSIYEGNNEYVLILAYTDKEF